MSLNHAADPGGTPTHYRCAGAGGKISSRLNNGCLLVKSMLRPVMAGKAQDTPHTLAARNFFSVLLTKNT